MRGLPREVKATGMAAGHEPFPPSPAAGDPIRLAPPRLRFHLPAH